METQAEYTTQSLTVEKEENEEGKEQLDRHLQQGKEAWSKLLTMFTPEPQQHVHGPFTFLMNQNHNALRGCTTCGATWVGVMAGVNESELRWHPVQEVDEEEE